VTLKKEEKGEGGGSLEEFGPIAEMRWNGGAIAQRHGRIFAAPRREGEMPKVVVLQSRLTRAAAAFLRRLAPRAESLARRVIDAAVERPIRLVEGRSRDAAAPSAVSVAIKNKKPLFKQEAVVGRYTHTYANFRLGRGVVWVPLA
jgi:hypothetical protein